MCEGKEVCKSNDTRNSHYICVLLLFLSLIPLRADREHHVTAPENKYGIQHTDKRQSSLSIQ